MHSLACSAFINAERKTDFEKLREVLDTIQVSGASKTSFILISLEWVSNMGGGLHIEL